MRRASTPFLFALAAVCWLAAGPGGGTLQALLACRHHMLHQSHPGHHPAPPAGPCFCGEMTGGFDLAVSPAIPVPLASGPAIVTAVRAVVYPSRFPVPPSPAFPPTPPPPNALV